MAVGKRVDETEVIADLRECTRLVKQTHNIATRKNDTTKDKMMII